ncbi:MAG: uracil-DNA glycosylase [Daejeonella sp.]
MAVQLEESWKKVLADQFDQKYMLELKEFLKKEQQDNNIVYPPNQFIFNAFEHTPFDKVKVVILGQDPYHGPKQAHGLSFSVQKGVRIPPSLNNIFLELQQEFPGYVYPNHGDLSKWANQGVLLLNATLTVQAQKAGSHQKRGWELFTNHAIEQLSKQRTGIVFLLWGRFAQEKAALIDEKKHFILKAAHPSPFSAHNGFFGCNHFIKTNEILVQNNLNPIDWQID